MKYINIMTMWPYEIYKQFLQSDYMKYIFGSYGNVTI